MNNNCWDIFRKWHTHFHQLCRNFQECTANNTTCLAGIVQTPTHNFDTRILDPHRRWANILKHDRSNIVILDQRPMWWNTFQSRNWCNRNLWHFLLTLNTCLVGNLCLWRLEKGEKDNGEKDKRGKGQRWKGQRRNEPHKYKLR